MEGAVLVDAMASGFYAARSLPDAVAALADRGAEGAPLAGATWLMRAPLRGERLPAALVSLSGVDALKAVVISEEAVCIGACVTHAQLADSLADLPDTRVLAQAAKHSANPAIRQMATVGGNLCSAGFAAADLVPALLCLEAEVDLASPGGAERLPLAVFLLRRGSLEPGCLLHQIIVPRRGRRSAHGRLPLRKAGDYPVAIVSLALVLDADCIAEARVAVGSVEAVARRWTSLEDRLVGHALDPRAAAEHARACCDAFEPRDGIEAPGWYRTAVLPALVRRAIEAVRP